jgi:hypothetical protein
MRAMILLLTAFLGGAMLVAGLVSSRGGSVSASTTPLTTANTMPLARSLAQSGGSVAPAAPSSNAYSCQGCEGRIEPLVEANGVTNPRGVHLRTGPSVTLTLQGSAFADVWDCFSASTVRAPWTGKACEASIRW